MVNVSLFDGNIIWSEWTKSVMDNTKMNILCEVRIYRFSMLFIYYISIRLTHPLTYITGSMLVV